ncbi:hypothetical protein ACP6PL_03650 [Dapis sp. BLCC M126]
MIEKKTEIKLYLNYTENPSYFAPYLKHQGRTIEEQIRLNQPAMNG